MSNASSPDTLMWGDVRAGRVLRLPAWLVWLVTVPLQIWIFFELWGAWGFWWTVLLFFVIGLMSTRAARAPMLPALLFPGWANRWENRRHVFQGALFLLAALTWLLPQTAVSLPGPLEAWADAWPQPWVPLAFAVALVKAAFR